MVNTMMQYEETDSSLSKTMKQKVVKYLQDCYMSADAKKNLSLLKKSSYLDPRFKQKYQEVEADIIAELKSGSFTLLDYYNICDFKFSILY